jgi:hypothetical protein
MKLKNISGKVLEIVDIPRIEIDEVRSFSKEQGEELLLRSSYFEVVGEEIKVEKKKKIKGIEKE